MSLYIWVTVLPSLPLLIQFNFWFGITVSKSLITQTRGSLTHNTEENDNAKYADNLAKLMVFILPFNPHIKRSCIYSNNSSLIKETVLRLICPEPTINLT